MADLSSKYPTLGSGGGLFLKLQDGDTVKVRIFSDPVYFDSEFKDNLSARIAWVVWNHDEQKAQIWATNGATYNSVKDLVMDEEYGDVTKYDIKITRTGTVQQTRYSVRPGVKKYPLLGAQIDACNAIDPIEVISRSETAQHVMYLEEHREEKAEKVIQVDEEPETPDEVDENVPEEEISLDNIPF